MQGLGLGRAWGVGFRLPTRLMRPAASSCAGRPAFKQYLFVHSESCGGVGLGCRIEVQASAARACFQCLHGRLMFDDWSL